MTAINKGTQRYQQEEKFGMAGKGKHSLLLFLVYGFTCSGWLGGGYSEVLALM